MKTGKCPKCGKVLEFIQFEEIPIKDEKDLFDTGVSLFCPYCQTILSVLLNTDSVATEILFNVKKILDDVSDVFLEVQSFRNDVHNLKSDLPAAELKIQKVFHRKKRKKN